MSMLKRIMNDQLKAAVEEIDALEHSTERTKLRIMLVNALANVGTADLDGVKTGKDSIKEDTAKEVVEHVEPEVIKPEEEVVDTENAIDAEVTEVEETTEEVEPVIALNENEEEVDVTEAYQWVQYAESEDERLGLALSITEYMCLPAYIELSELVVKNAEGEDELLRDDYNKFMLAYYLTPYEDSATGLDFVNEQIAAFTDGQDNNYAEFINNENIAAFIEYLSN